MKKSLRSWLWSVPLEQEVDEELAFHRQMRARERHDAGTDPRVRDTLITIGRKRDREMRLTQWIEDFHKDVGVALRQIRRAPGFTLIAVVTLALGIGANSAIFAVADAVLLKPLPFNDPDRLVMVWEGRTEVERIPANPLNFADWRARNRSFTALAGIVGSGATMTGSDGLPERVAAHAVTTEFFEVLAVRPLAGRTFQAADNHRDADVVVLAEGYWRRRFGADPAVVGRTVPLNNRPFTVIGIVPAHVQLDLPATGTPGAVDLWTVFRIDPDRTLAQRRSHFVQVVGRLKPRVAMDAARADLAAIATDLGREFPGTNAGHGVTIASLHDAIIGSDVRTTTLLVFSVVGVILVICCANVAHLLLSRLSRRSRELAVRSAMGAGRERVIRQLITEMLVLGAGGGLGGLAIGLIILRIAPTVVPSGLIPATIMLAFDSRVAAFCAATACAAAFVCGLFPAWGATSRSPLMAIRNEARTATPAEHTHRRWLVAGEVAAAVILLCGAGLLVRTAMALGNVDAGHGARSALTMVVGAPFNPAGPYGRETSRGQFYEAVEREVESVPGVASVAFGTTLPLGGHWYQQSFEVVGAAPRREADRPAAVYQLVSPSYFEVLEIPVLQGRPFTASDRDGAPQVCVVDEAFVRRFISGRAPIGTRLNVRALAQLPADVEREIVGVVRQVKEQAEETADVPHIYVPLSQNPWWSATLVVRPTGGDPAALAPAVRAAIGRIDKAWVPTLVRTLDDAGRAATSRPRFRAVLVATCAGLSLLLALIGVFGVLAYGVDQRTREFGIRLALGAERREVLRLVLASAGRMIAAGAIAGLMVSALLARTIDTFLFQVEPLDAVTFTVVPALVALAGALAATLPALRAARVDPVVAFRQD
jgi:putative ABC transport system permease protein